MNGYFVERKKMFNRVFNFQKNRSLRSGLPNMANTLNGWEVPLTLIKIKQSINGVSKASRKKYPRAKFRLPF